MKLEDLTRIVGSFAAEFPEIDEAQNDHAYLQLLAGTNLDQADHTAQRLLKKQPDLLAYRTTAALSALRHQKPGAATASTTVGPPSGPKPRTGSKPCIWRC